MRLYRNIRPRVLAAALAAMCLVGALPAQRSVAEEAATLPEAIELYYFHETVCGSCDGAKEFIDLYNEELTPEDRALYPVKIYPYNIYQRGGKETFADTLARFGHSTENLSYPVLMINSKLFSGIESIRSNLREAFLTAGEDIFVNEYVYNKLTEPEDIFARIAINPEHSTALYFYRITCDECGATKPFIDSLPETVQADGTDAPLDVILLNTRSGNVRDILYELFDRYDVPDENRTVPIVFLADGYLCGQEQIETNLLQDLQDGKGLNFTLSSQTEAD
ncbi:MAG: hypothetical protein LBH66_02745 [Oscillospiraceae bacterium]|nr:hypothetical protein [Oscillospiraceae bacterium]